MTDRDCGVVKEIEKEGVTYRLVTPSLRYEASFRQYITELKGEERYPFVLDLESTDFSAYLTRLAQIQRGIDLPKGYVESSTFWLMCGETIVGVSNLRHRLNEEIAQVGGHIGLSVRPSFRGRGMSTLLLRWTCEVAHAMGIGKSSGNVLHVHCYSHNKPSQRMITSVGGVLHSVVTTQAHSVSRYTIELLD